MQNSFAYGFTLFFILYSSCFGSWITTNSTNSAVDSQLGAEMNLSLRDCHSSGMCDENGTDMMMGMAMSMMDEIEEMMPEMEPMTGYTKPVMLEEAKCGLYDHVVEFPNTDPSTLLIPGCVTVKRCRGCTYYPALLTCGPASTDEIPVMVTAWTLSGQWSLMNSTFVKVTNHTSCSTQCRVKESDCNLETQRYDLDSCACKCRAELQWQCSHSLKYWDSKDCSCKCRRDIECGPGRRFDRHLCKCVIDLNGSE